MFRMDFYADSIDTKIHDEIQRLNVELNQRKYERTIKCPYHISVDIEKAIEILMCIHNKGLTNMTRFDRFYDEPCNNELYSKEDRFHIFGNWLSEHPHVDENGKGDLEALFARAGEEDDDDSAETFSNSWMEYENSGKKNKEFYDDWFNKSNDIKENLNDLEEKIKKKEETMKKSTEAPKVFEYSFRPVSTTEGTSELYFNASGIQHQFVAYELKQFEVWKKNGKNENTEEVNSDFSNIAPVEITPEDQKKSFYRNGYKREYINVELLVLLVREWKIRGRTKSGNIKDNEFFSSEIFDEYVMRRLEEKKPLVVNNENKGDFINWTTFSKDLLDEAYYLFKNQSKISETYYFTETKKNVNTYSCNTIPSTEQEFDLLSGGGWYQHMKEVFVTSPEYSWAEKDEKEAVAKRLGKERELREAKQKLEKEIQAEESRRQAERNEELKKRNGEIRIKREKEEEAERARREVFEKRRAEEDRIQREEERKRFAEKNERRQEQIRINEERRRQAAEERKEYVRETIWGNHLRSSVLRLSFAASFVLGFFYFYSL
jgi:hypothetical protein